MKEIPLSRGKFALVDDKYFEVLSKNKWCSCKVRDSGYYAQRRVSGHCVIMHRLIMELESGTSLAGKTQIDHKDGNGLNNQIENLRVCNNAQNHFNMRKKAKASSVYKGVYFHKSSKKWAAVIHPSGRSIYIGIYADELDAARAYNRKATEIYGEFACLNEVDQ